MPCGLVMTEVACIQCAWLLAARLMYQQQHLKTGKDLKHVFKKGGERELKIGEKENLPSKHYHTYSWQY